MRRLIGAVFVLLVLVAPVWADPPGFNVHLVVQTSHGTFWRGGAPRQDTMEALAHSKHVTLIDLRHPANSDDVSGKQGRLSPHDEAALAESLGFEYLSMSALDPTLPARIDQALRHGDVYIHCMYGVNRTGFAIARYALTAHLDVPRDGLGPHDWDQGATFQRAQH